MDFVYSAALLRAQEYGYEPLRERAAVREIAASHKPTPFKPQSGVKIAVNDAEAKEQNEGTGALDFNMSCVQCVHL